MKRPAFLLQQEYTRELGKIRLWRALRGKEVRGDFKPVDLVTCNTNIKPNTSQVVQSKKILSNRLHCFISTYNTQPVLLFRERFHKRSWKIEHKTSLILRKQLPRCPSSCASSPTHTYGWLFYVRNFLETATY